MAREANVKSIVSSEPPESLGTPYWNLLSVDVEREDGTKSSITGAVFGNAPHIIKVDQYSDSFAFKPEGNYILTFRNADRPGAISEVLEVLHLAGVNIASMTVARPNSPPGSKASTDPAQNMALTFMALDDDVGTNAMKKLKSLNFLDRVAKMQLR
jgi:hypothetical protein